MNENAMISSRLAKPRAPKTRSRHGCLTCRRRRLKCDEVSPSCNNCRTHDRACEWGLKASFHSSRMRFLSKPESAFISTLEAKKNRPSALKFVDNTEEIENYYQNSDHWSELSESPSGDCDSVSNSNRRERSDASLREPALETTTNSLGQTSFKGPSGSSQYGSPAPPGHAGSINATDDRDQPQRQDSRMGDLTLSRAHGESLSVISAISPETIATISASNDKMPSWPIDDGIKARLISSWLRETASWCETTDSHRHFSQEACYSLTGCQALSAAAVAVASRQADNTAGNARVETLELYDFARETICSLEAWQNNHLVLASAVQLCVYCMMSMEVNEWRLHLRGCAGTFLEMGWNGASGGLPAACFWAFARIDIWAAYLTAQRTLIPTDVWITPDYETADSAPIQDRYANKAIWIFARIINRLSERDSLGKGGLTLHETVISELVQLWEELDLWHLNRPGQVQSLMEVKVSKGEAFPFILFGNPSAICGNMFYHTGCLLLLETGIQKLSKRDDDFKFTPSWHARRIGGISTTTDNHANWVNNLQPLYIAAHHYSDASEKITVLKHLRDIELSTGWKTGGRAAELRALWGLG